MPEPASFAAHRRAAPWLTRSAWPCAWISGPETAPTVGAYRLRFASAQAERLRLVVSADERYRLYVDGRLLGSGPELGTRWRWQADLVEVDLDPGEHLLLAVVWSVGALDGDFATDGITHGFALGVDGEAATNARLATGTAAWEWHALPGYTFRKSPLAHWTVPDLHRDGSRIDWAAERGAGNGWSPVRTVSLVHHVADVEIFPARLVESGSLPPQIHQPWTSLSVRHAQVLPTGCDPIKVALGPDDADLGRRCAAMLRGDAPLVIAPRTTLRVVLDCGTYLTAWPDLSAGGTDARISLEWMEALALQPVDGSLINKGNRAEISGRFVRGLGDHLVCDATVRSWRPLFWRSGRFVILTVTTGDAPATVADLVLTEIRYPLEQKSRLEIGHAGLTRALPLCLRTLQVNAHDQFSDTPYYERMQYLGDCRLDCLNTYVLTRDHRLVEKALRMADAQRMPDGLTVSRTPTRNLQVIPTFSLWYVGMVRDHLWWHGNPDLARSLMPGVRGVLEAFLRHRTTDGTLGHMEGWNFCDWTEPFPNGEPPGNAAGASPANFQLLMALAWAEELETALGEGALAGRWRRIRRQLARCVQTTFWDRQRGAWADDRAHTAFSQHAQALAALAPGLDRAKQQRGLRRLGRDRSLAPASLYFTHYLIEAWARFGDGASILAALDFWAKLPEQGFCTLPEAPEPSRSDCHAWCAHPLFHTAATLAGIRPDAPAFARVRIAPCPGSIPHLSVRIPHPAGDWITCELRFTGQRMQGRIELPQGVDGSVVWAGLSHQLRPGANELDYEQA